MLWIDLVLLGVGVVLTVGTGLFVAAEFALVNLDRSDLEARQRAGEKGLENADQMDEGDMSDDFEEE